MKMVKTLLAAKAEVDKANNKGMTPLHEASGYGQPKVVKALVAAGAEANKADNAGQNPLCWAHSTKIAALLRAVGATE